MSDQKLDAWDIADALILAAIHSLQQTREASAKLKAKHDAGESVTADEVYAVLDEAKAIGQRIRDRVATSPQPLDPSS